ncbi:MAG: sulfotransferase family protein, partial [Mycobacterium sp.]
ALYAELGRELSPVAEKNMRAHLAAHPGGGGGSRYAWADTGLDAGQVREQVREYQQRFGVPDEPLK